MRVGACKGSAYHSVQEVLLVNGDRYEVDCSTFFPSAGKGKALYNSSGASGVARTELEDVTAPGRPSALPQGSAHRDSDPTVVLTTTTVSSPNDTSELIRMEGTVPELGTTPRNATSSRDLGQTIPRFGRTPLEFGTVEIRDGQVYYPFNIKR
jgi:hypothetical protein